MSKLRYIILIILTLVVTNSFAQKETNHWFFSTKLGLDFNSDPPIVTEGGAVNISVDTGAEIASMSDKNGNLLFYTDGNVVYNKNHAIMQNGSNIYGRFPGNTQSVIIIPKPNNPNAYYIFVTRGRIRFSEVDMSLGSGLGTVTIINEELPHENRLINHITAIKSPVCEEEYWVVTHEDWDFQSSGSNKFVAYKITSQGVNKTPVISPLGGNLYYLKVGDNNYDSNLLIKFSPDGRKLALGGKDAGQLTLSDFDPITGKFSNIKYLNYRAEDVEFSPNSKVLYASKKFTRFETGPSDEIYQYNIESNIQTEIYTSKILVANGDEGRVNHGDLQLASNGKIYIFHTSVNGANIDVINNPNVVGTGCNIEYDLFVGIDRTVRRTPVFPNFMPSYFRVPEITFENLCFGDTTEFYLTDTVDSVVWDFGDPVTGANNTSTDIEPTHVFSAPGCYNISATATIATITSTGIIGTQTIIYREPVTIYPLPVVEPLVELVQCENDLDSFSQFNLNEVVDKISANASNEIFTFFESEAAAISGDNAITNSINYTNTIPNMDTVWARIEDVNGCFSTSQVNLKVVNTQIPSTFIRDFYACDNLDGDDTNGISVFDFSSVENEILSMFPNPEDLLINYYRNGADALSESNPITDIANYSNVGYPNTQGIYVRLDSKTFNDCIGLGKHINLTVNPLPDFTIEPTQVLCNTDPASTIVLDPIENNPLETFTYSWMYDGIEISTSSTLTVSATGTYSITLTKTDGTGCSRTTEVFVIGSEIATVTQNDITVVDISENNSITVKNPNSLGNGDYWFALESEDGTVSYPYQNEPVFNNLKGGIYTLFVEDKNGCGTATLPISVIGYPKFFTPNNDGINDFWQIQGIDGLIQSDSSIHIFDRYGKLLKQLNPAETGWDGTFNGYALTTDDYWFKLILQDGRTVLGHFALKR